MHCFVDAGKTVVIVEHNLEVVKNADSIIDLGSGRGHIVAEGTPEDALRAERSSIGR